MGCNCRRPLSLPTPARNTGSPMTSDAPELQSNTRASLFFLSSSPAPSSSLTGATAAVALGFRSSKLADADGRGVCCLDECSENRSAAPKLDARNADADADAGAAGCAVRSAWAPSETLGDEHAE